MSEGYKKTVRGFTVFSHLATLKFAVCLLQEVHLRNENDVSKFSKVWVMGDSRWSVAGVHSTGVGLLCGNNGDMTIQGSFSPVQGRVLVDLIWKGKQIRIINIYAHTEPAARRELLNSLDSCFTTNIIVYVAGDLNTSLGRGSYKLPLKSLLVKCSLIDAYRA